MNLDHLFNMFNQSKLTPICGFLAGICTLFFGIAVLFVMTILVLQDDFDPDLSPVVVFVAAVALIVSSIGLFTSLRGLTDFFMQRKKVRVVRDDRVYTRIMG